MSICFGFYYLENKKSENWSNKVSFQNYQIESIFFIIENQTNWF